MKVFTVTVSVAAALFFAGVLGYLYWIEFGLWAIAIYAAMLLALPFSSLMHELGHMLFGAICRIKAKPQFRLFGSSSCSLLPKTHKNLRARVYFTAKGGVIVNLLFFILGLVAILARGVPSWLALFAPASVYLYILNDMPVEFAGGKTDGLVCYQLLTRSAEAVVMLAVLGVQARVLNGQSITEIEESALFDLPQIREDDPAFISLTELRYEYCKAVGDEKSAESYKERFERLKEEYL